MGHQVLHHRVFGHVLHEIRLLHDHRRTRVNGEPRREERRPAPSYRGGPRALTEVYARPHMLQLYALAFLMACADRWICSDAESE